MDVDDFVLYLTSNGKFYLGRIIDLPRESELLTVQYGDNKSGSHHDFTHKKTTYVAKGSVVRWGSLDDVGAECVGENLYKVGTVDVTGLG